MCMVRVQYGPEHLIRMNSWLWVNWFEYKKLFGQKGKEFLPSYLHKFKGSFKIIISKIQLVVYRQCCILNGWATSRLYAIAHQ